MPRSRGGLRPSNGSSWLLIWTLRMRSASPPGTYPGMVVTRLPASWTPAAVAARLVAVLQEGSDLTLDGAITIVEVDHVRVFSTPSKP